MTSDPASQSLKVGTRGSALALVQAGMTEAALTEAHPNLVLERVVVKTIGDKRTDLRFSEFGAKGEAIVDKGIFTKELEEALADGGVDLAVHSLKDVPTELADGYSIVCVLPRAPIEDVLVSQSPGGIAGLPEGARIGTSSVRRIRQLQQLRPDCVPVEIRGNVPTRIRKAAESEDGLHGVLLARAGLERLGILGADKTLHYEILDPVVFLPAAAQGAVGIEVHSRSGSRVTELLQSIHCTDTGDRVALERAFLAALGAGCETPVGLHTALGSDKKSITICARVFPDDPESQDPVAEGQITGDRNDPQGCAMALHNQLFPST